MQTPHWLALFAPTPDTNNPCSVIWSDKLFARPEKAGAALPQHLQETLFDTDKGSTFAVLDGAILTNLPERLASSELEYACLYSGKAAANLGEIAPYLVRLEAEEDLTQKLLTDGDAPWHNWRDPIGLFLQSNSDLPDLRQHLRKFTRLPKWDTGADLPPEAPSFITRVCGFGFHILDRWFGQARCARSPQIAQAHDVLQRVFYCPAMNAV